MKKYTILALMVFFTALGGLIIYTLIQGNYYKLSAADVHDISLRQDILYTMETLEAADADPLIIMLSEPGDSAFAMWNAFRTVTLKPSELLHPHNKRTYSKHDGSLVIYAQNPAVSASAWVLLTRKGYKNVFVFDEAGIASLKYTFQSDSGPD